MTPLYLHVQSQYFVQIKAGTKTEEYRLHNAAWVKRLVDMPSGAKREFSGIVIFDAYRKASADTVLRFPWRGWKLKGITHPHFGPDEVTVFAIKLEASK